MKGTKLRWVIVIIITGLIVGTFWGSQAKSSKMKFAVIGMHHPYFASWEPATRDFMEKTGIECVYRETSRLSQEEENQIVEELVPLGYNGYALFPQWPGDVNILVTDLVEKGYPVVLVGAPSEQPTNAALCIATDIKKAAMIATENLIRILGGKGNIVNLFCISSDPNTILRKEGVKAAVARYPQVKIVADIDVWEAGDKIDSLLTEGEIDGMVAIDYLATGFVTEALMKSGNKRIKFIGMDDDAMVLKGIKEGYVTGTMVQAPYAQAYLGLEALRLLKSGYTVKEGVWFVDSGVTYVDINNIETYQEQMHQNFLQVLGRFVENYFNSPVLAIDISTIRGKVKEKYAKFGEEIKDMTIFQEMKMVTEEGEVTEEIKMFKKGKKFRIETTMQMPEIPEMPEEMALTQIIIYDGKDTWMISPFLGKQKLPYEEGKEYQMGMDWWEFISEKTKVVGTEKAGERECYVVDVEEEKELLFTRLWLDKENLTLIKGESKKPEEKTTTWMYSDFRKIVNELEMPYRTEMYTDGVLVGTLLIKSLEINSGLSDDLFDPDKVEVKGFNMEEMMKKMMQE